MATLAQGLQNLKKNAGVKVAVGLAALGALSGCKDSGPTTEERVTALEQGQSNTVARVDGLTREVGEVRTNMAKLTGLVFSISTNVTGMRAEVGAVKNDVATVQQGLVDLKADLNNELANIRNEIAASEARTLGVVTNYAGRGTTVVLNSAGQAVVTGSTMVQAPAPTQPQNVVVVGAGLPTLNPGSAIPGVAGPGGLPIILAPSQYATAMPDGGFLIWTGADPGVRGLFRQRGISFLSDSGLVYDIDGYRGLGLPGVRLSPGTEAHRAHKSLATYARNKKVREYCRACNASSRRAAR